MNTNKGMSRAPRVVLKVKPDYTAAAKKERIQGRVLLEAVVKDNGSVGEVKSPSHSTHGTGWTRRRRKR